MSDKIRLAIAGVGNCASSLVQGLFYYDDVNSNGETVPGLMHNVLGGYKISDIEPVAAFDVDRRKVGKDLSKAVDADPNCTKKFAEVPELGVEVMKGPLEDGIASHMEEFEDEKTFLPSNSKAVDVAKVLKERETDVLVNYMPVGSEKAAKRYAEACLESDTAMLNCMPVFIASDRSWVDRFRRKNIPIAGDDIKSMIGATITHRALTKLLSDRGVKLDRTYQLNTGGNTDFLNMLERNRLKTKKISKTEAVQSQLPEPLDEDKIHIGPSDYVPWQDDNKIAFIRLEGRKFGDVPMNMEVRLSVEDSPNSAGCAIDGIRACKLASDRGIAGPLTSISSYIMKRPPKQFSDDVARQRTEKFIQGERER